MSSPNKSLIFTYVTRSLPKRVRIVPNEDNTLQKMINNNRQLIKHGQVTVTSLNKSQYTYLLLFSDVAVFACPSQKAKKLEMKEKIKLEQVLRFLPVRWFNNSQNFLCQVWVDAMKDTSSAELIWQLNAPGNTFLVASANKEDKTLWVDKCHQRIVATCQKKGVCEGNRVNFVLSHSQN